MLEIAFVRPLLQLALIEDIGGGDITSQLLIPEYYQARMQLVAREPLVCAGAIVAQEAFHMLEGDVTTHFIMPEGSNVEEGAVMLDISGNARTLLSAERTALNVMQRMCGVATLTSKYVQAVEGTGSVILDTRKTMPGMRLLDKYAVAVGGGMNHRMGLYDAVMIKDNHIALLGGIAEAVSQARAGTDRPIIVECDTLEQVAEALAAKPDRILLDNMRLEEMREAVRMSASTIPLEASGGIGLDRVTAIAETGVNFISVGKITHSVRAADIGADVVIS